MNKQVIKQDRIRIGIYTMGYLVLSLISFYLTALTYTIGQYLLSFLCLTALWFMVKFFLRYGKIFIKDIPCVSFDATELTINVLGQGQHTLQYSDCKKVRLLYKHNAYKLFIESPSVNHPSGFFYIGIIYWFKKKELDNVKEIIINSFAKHYIKVEVIKED